MNIQQQWSISPGVVARYWEDGSTVIFHRPSGSTHQLSPLGAFLINSLSHASSSSAVLQQLCVDEFELTGESNEILEILQEALSGLQQLALVKSTPL